jgi:hypothetical protein
MTPAERLARQHRTRREQVSETAGQLATVPPNSQLDPLDAVVDGRKPGLLDAHLEAALSPAEPPRKRRRRPRNRGEMGTQWYHCLLYPFRAWLLVGGLAAALTYLTTIGLLLLPALLDAGASASKQVLTWVVFPALSQVVLGYTCAFLHCVLTSSIAGENRHVHWPGRDVPLVMKAIATWFICFVAGPIVPATVALWFWLNWGNPTFLDVLIMAELVTATACYWLLAILTVAQTGRLRDSNPLRVADGAYDLGWRRLLVVVGAGTVAAAYGFWAGIAVDFIHKNLGLAWLLLGTCWLSGLYLATFFMRYLGLCFYRIRMTAALQPSS